MSRNRRGGWTIPEVLAIGAAAACLLGLTLPGIHAGSCDAMRTRSVRNLARLGLAHAAYAADWNDRQFTLIRDDVGMVGGETPAAVCEAYRKQIGCHSPVILGDDCDGITRGLFFGCDGAGSCNNFIAAIPYDFQGSGTEAQRARWCVAGAEHPAPRVGARPQ